MRSRVEWQTERDGVAGKASLAEAGRLGSGPQVQEIQDYSNASSQGNEELSKILGRSSISR